MTGVGEAPTGAATFDLLRMDREIVRRQRLRRVAKVAGWTGLTAFSIRRGRVLGWLIAGGAIYGLVRELSEWSAERPEWRKHSGHAGDGVVRRLLNRHPRSTGLEEPSTLSFPASDPPARTVG